MIFNSCQVGLYGKKWQGKKGMGVRAIWVAEIVKGLIEIFAVLQFSK